MAAGAGDGIVPLRPGLGPGTRDSDKDTCPSFFLVGLSDIQRVTTSLGEGLPIKRTRRDNLLIPIGLTPEVGERPAHSTHVPDGEGPGPSFHVKGGCRARASRTFATRALRVRLLVHIHRVPMSEPAVPDRGLGVLPGRFVFAHLVMVGRLQVMMRGGRVMGGGPVMVLRCRMLPDGRHDSILRFADQGRGAASSREDINDLYRSRRPAIGPTTSGEMAHGT
jgi:hypothetical protein